MTSYMEQCQLMTLLATAGKFPFSYTSTISVCQISPKPAELRELLTKTMPTEHIQLYEMLAQDNYMYLASLVSPLSLQL